MHNKFAPHVLTKREKKQYNNNLKFKHYEKNLLSISNDVAWHGRNDG